MPAAAPDDIGPRPPEVPGGVRALDLSERPVDALPLSLHLVQRRLAVGTRIEVTVAADIGTDRLRDLVVGAGFEQLDVPSRGDRADGDRGGHVIVATRARTLADSVAPGMTLLVCGVNPSPYSADAGVGYARPGNRFWPAALGAGVAAVDRDPVAALAHGLGMTDFAKRATRTAAEVTRDEYTAGFARVTRLVDWLRPGAVCFVGLSGRRTVVDRRAVSGVQPSLIGGRPAYVMPSTSGLNARTSLAELSDHLRAAWVLAGGTG